MSISGVKENGGVLVYYWYIKIYWGIGLHLKI